MSLCPEDKKFIKDEISQQVGCLAGLCLLFFVVLLLVTVLHK